MKSYRRNADDICIVNSINCGYIYLANDIGNGECKMVIHLPISCAIISLATGENIR